MSLPSAQQNILPDPNNRIHISGWNGGGSYGPGFASVSLTSEQKVMKSRTNSGRLVTRMASGHTWKLAIKYNPLTREDFEPVANFLVDKRGSLEAFYVSLPQHQGSRNNTFQAFLQNAITNNGANPNTTTAAVASGNTVMMLAGFPTTDFDDNSPQPGDIFSIDNSDPLHTKVYKVTKVENNDKFSDDNHRPTTAQRRVHFIPALTKAIGSGDKINFYNPKIRVVISNDAFTYELNENNLYTFNLDLEEAAQ